MFRWLWKHRPVTNRRLLREIRMNNAELTAKLDAQTTRVNKIITEIQALKVIIANADNVPQNVIDAVARLDAATQAADDQNPDA